MCVSSGTALQKKYQKRATIRVIHFWEGSQTCSPRVDAQGSDDRTGVGGWLPNSDEQGRGDPRQSYWFSLEVTPEDFPWVFARGKKPSQIISTLEALAVLLSLKLFATRQPEGQRSRVTILPTWTDNRGNGSVLNKLMTTQGKMLVLPNQILY